ncbi:hypothetical protein E2C01_018827 [Portunus trituberculatus]|uniref:Uncharacterized protein n=1 Tax=Portunus trituberculatus TaxID=210409 RepID=A0A5B7DWP8_PORTR|nr:hypothetical protein [Portunus trituberculatus]
MPRVARVLPPPCQLGLIDAANYCLDSPVSEPVGQSLASPRPALQPSLNAAPDHCPVLRCYF